MVGLVVIWLFFGIAAGLVGAQKGEGVVAFILGFILGPIGLLFAIFSAGDRIPCPHCRTRIDPDASVCARCGRDVSIRGPVR